MPTYDYRCKECGYTFEEFQSMSAEPLLTCPSCGKPELKRLLAGGAGMIFKGSGFYLTDYKTKSASKESESKPASESSEPAKTKKKPGSPSSEKETK